MSKQEIFLYNLVQDFVHVARLDNLEWEDWPEESKELFQKMQEWAKSH